MSSTLSQCLATCDILEKTKQSCQAFSYGKGLKACEYGKIKEDTIIVPSDHPSAKKVVYNKSKRPKKKGGSS